MKVIVNNCKRNYKKTSSTSVVSVPVDNAVQNLISELYQVERSKIKTQIVSPV